MIKYVRAAIALVFFFAIFRNLRINWTQEWAEENCFSFQIEILSRKNAFCANRAIEIKFFESVYDIDLFVVTSHY